MNYPLDSNTISELYDRFSAGYPKIFQNLASLTDDELGGVNILNKQNSMKVNMSHTQRAPRNGVRNSIQTVFMTLISLQWRRHNLY